MNPIFTLWNYESSLLLHSSIYLENQIISSEPFVGTQGGICTCPNQNSYLVGQYTGTAPTVADPNNPANLACVHGMAGSVLYTDFGEWSNRKVICSQGFLDRVSTVIDQMVNPYIVERYSGAAVVNGTNNSTTETILEIKIYAVGLMNDEYGAECENGKSFDKMEGCWSGFMSGTFDIEATLK